MKNKWVKVIVMIVTGFLAYSVGQTGDGVINNISTIVGVILFIGGIVEIFKSKKQPPIKS